MALYRLKLALDRSEVLVLRSLLLWQVWVPQHDSLMRYSLVHLIERYLLVTAEMILVGFVGFDLVDYIPRMAD